MPAHHGNGYHRMIKVKNLLAETHSVSGYTVTDYTSSKASSTKLSSPKLQAQGSRSQELLNLSLSIQELQRALKERVQLIKDRNPEDDSPSSLQIHYREIVNCLKDLLKHDHQFFELILFQKSQLSMNDYCKWLNQGKTQFHTYFESLSSIEEIILQILDRVEQLHTKNEIFTDGDFFYEIEKCSESYANLYNLCSYLKVQFSASSEFNEIYYNYMESIKDEIMLMFENLNDLNDTNLTLSNNVPSLEELIRTLSSSVWSSKKYRGTMSGSSDTHNSSSNVSTSSSSKPGLVLVNAQDSLMHEHYKTLLSNFDPLTTSLTEILALKIEDFTSTHKTADYLLELIDLIKIKYNELVAIYELLETELKNLKRKIFFDRWCQVFDFHFSGLDHIVNVELPSVLVTVKNFSSEKHPRILSFYKTVIANYAQMADKYFKFADLIIGKNISHELTKKVTYKKNDLNFKWHKFVRDAPVDFAECFTKPNEFSKTFLPKNSSPSKRNVQSVRDLMSGLKKTENITGSLQKTNVIRRNEGLASKRKLRNSRRLRRSLLSDVQSSKLSNVETDELLTKLNRLSTMENIEEWKTLSKEFGRQSAGALIHQRLNIRPVVINDSDDLISPTKKDFTDSEEQLSDLENLLEADLHNVPIEDDEETSDEAYRAHVEKMKEVDKSLMKQASTSTLRISEEDRTLLGENFVLSPSAITFASSRPTVSIFQTLKFKDTLLHFSKLDTKIKAPFDSGLAGLFAVKSPTSEDFNNSDFSTDNIDEDPLTPQHSNESVCSLETQNSLSFGNKSFFTPNIFQVIRRKSGVFSRKNSAFSSTDDFNKTVPPAAKKNAEKIATSRSRSSSISSELSSMNLMRTSSSGCLTHSYHFDAAPAQQLFENGGYTLYGTKDHQAKCRYNENTLQQGVSLIRVTRKKSVNYKFTLINDQLLHWKDKYIDIDTIKDIRVLDSANNYREQLGVSSEKGQHWITIIYQVPPNKLKALHLYAANAEDFQSFYAAIYYKTKQRHDMFQTMAFPSSNEFTTFHWNLNKTAVSTKSDKNSQENTHNLNFENVATICSKFNIFCSDSYLHTLYKRADLNDDGLLNHSEFQYFVKLLKNRPEISRIMQDISKNGKYLDFDDFKKFSTNIQNEELAENDLEAVFEKYKHGKLGIITTEGFLKLLAEQPYLFAVDSLSYYDRPLNQYFISSSHNTYLRGNQVGNSSTVESYIEALQKGCRCIEVDVWDGENGPVVCHGILTGSISMKSVMEVVRKYAFITSPYPLLLSFEVHCKDANQIIMIYLIKEYLGDLLAPKFETELPSPNSLKNKIVLKFTKRGKIYNSEGLPSSTTSLESSDDEDLLEQKSRNIKNPFHLGKKNKVAILPMLLELSNIEGIAFKNFSLSESKTPAHSFSFNEKRFQELTRNKYQEYAVDKHNRKFLMRVYPHALRYKSTNFNPIDFWRLGVQMVATNWQTNDLGQQLNNAMFLSPMAGSSHWNSGYVLKPDYMLPPVKIKQMSQYRNSVQFSLLHVEVDVIIVSRKDSPDTLLDILTEVEFISDMKVKSPITIQSGNAISDTKAQTKYIRENGVSPIWNTHISIALYDTGLNFVLFNVKTKNSIVLGTCCIKLHNLRKGYRQIPLFNAENGEKFIFSTLFIKIDY
ncbi:hypothetical protein ACO0QE_003669 [Hanseniaspora vineae]